MISKEEVVRIAKLARLELADEEIIKMQKDMSAILDYFEILKKAPKAKPQSASAKTPEWRKDEIILSRNIAGELIESAPDKKDGYIKVKTIL